MGIFICKICQKECKGILGLRSHSALLHKITSEDVYVEYILNGVHPKCECGCMMDTTFISINKGFSRFIQSHHNRVLGKNNFHKNPETHKKALATQRANWKLGKYKGWWENSDKETKQKIEGIKDKLRNNKERGIKISNSLKGIPKSEKSKLKSSKTQTERYKNDPNLALKLSEKRINWIKTQSGKYKTKLEDKFESIIKLLNLDYQYQYEFKHKFFDFLLIKENMLIEVDGDFHHCNPNTKHGVPKYKIQELTLKNDKIKNIICVENNITLLRYWEKDINERPEWVISDLKEKLKLKTLLCDSY